VLYMYNAVHPFILYQLFLVEATLVLTESALFWLDFENYITGKEVITWKKRR
jgi:hypothetical protein